MYGVRVEDRRPIGRPINTWLESVEADMAKLVVDGEDVQDRKKWRKMLRRGSPTLSENGL